MTTLPNYNGNRYQHNKSSKRKYQISLPSDESDSYLQNQKFLLTQNSNDDQEKVFKTVSNQRKSVFNKKFFFNECPGGKSCKNYKTISELELQIQKLLRTIEELKKMNEYFKFALSQKDKMYKLMINEMNSQKRVNNKRNHSKGEKNHENLDENQEKANYFEKNENDEEKKQETLPRPSLKQKRIKKRTATVSFSKSQKSRVYQPPEKRQSEGIPLYNFENEHSKQFFLKSNIYNIDSYNDNNFSYRPFHSSNGLLTNKGPNYKIIKNNPYDKLMEMSTRGQKHKLQNSSGVSFLALSDERLAEMSSNESLKNLYQLTLSDEVFINEFQNSSKEELTHYCDLIGTVTKDYQSTIKLIRRIKDFMAASVELVSSVLYEDSTSVLIRNTCRILDCERVSLFIHDRLTDMLVVHSAQGLQKNQIKIPKNKGIVGAVFMTGEKLKIDDAYQDARFNKEVDKMTNYRTRNIICYPLIDKDGDVFGAIQAINKRKTCFDNNDEEILSIFSLQASAILKNMMNMDANTLQISRLKMIILYSIKISNIHSLEEFSEETEKIIMDLFFSDSAMILININDTLYNAKTKNFITQKNLGIVDYVFTKKECHGCSDLKKCHYYNILVDIPAHESLVTYPVIEKNKETVLGIIQTQYNYKLSNTTEKPKNNEMVIFNMVENCFIDWIKRNRDEIEKVKLNQ